MAGKTQRELVSDALATYRYLRLSIVVVTSALLASLAFEAIGEGCFVGSISGYYYTPVRSLFVGGLVAIGVCLIAIKEDRPRKDALLNLSGALAPIVAFVPTEYPEPGCTSTAHAFFDTNPGIVNNIAAYAICGTIAVIIGWVVRPRRRTGPDDTARGSGTVLTLAAAMLVGGVAWYFVWHESFLAHAHIYSAFGLFGVVGVVMFLNSRDTEKNTAGYRRIYRWTAVAMAAGVVVTLVVKGLIVKDWHHQVLVLELVEMAAFLAYWIVQTVQHWDDGLEPAAPTKRVAKAP